MKVLIVTQYFWPENFKINEVALYLKEQGNEVTILTGQPNYPEGKFFKGYSFSKPNMEVYNGINVYRLPTIPRGKGNPLKLILNYFFFPFIGRLYWKNLLRGKVFDIIFVCQLSPVFVGLLGARIKKKLKIPMIMWVLDLWPESVFAASKIKPFLVEKALKFYVNRIYHSCDRILVSSRSFKNSIMQYGYPQDSISYLPNWAEIQSNNLVKHEIDNLPIIPKGFVILFAGNLGEAQDLETIIKGAELTIANEEIKWVFLGDGRKRDWLQKEIKNRNLNKTVFWLGRFPSNVMPYFYQNASILLVSLKINPVFELTVPAKLQSYLASKKAILSMLSGEGNKIVNEAGCGMTVNSGDHLSLAKAVEKLYKSSVLELEMMSNKGYDYFLTNFEKNKVLKNLELYIYEKINK